MITQVRTARPSIMIGGTDFYSRLAPYLLKFQYTDSADGSHTDDCQFQLADRDRMFINAWMPAPGATFDASILCERWFGPTAAALSLDCGTFYIDSIEFDLPAHTVSVKANAIPNNTHGKVSNETRGWPQTGDGTSLMKIADEIATANNLHLKWMAGDRNPQYDRVEQVEESAFQFLKRHAEDAKLEIKVAKGLLMVYDPLTLDQQGPSFTLVYGDAQAFGDTTVFRMSGGRFRLQVTDLTAATTISNTDMDSGGTTSRQFDANSLLKGTGVGAGESLALPSTWNDNLNWNTDVKPAAGSDAPQQQQDGGESDYNSDDPNAADAALTKAQARTREKNRRQYESDIEMSIGNPLIAAGQTFMLAGCGQFDGKWFIEQAHHVVGPQYDTALHIRRTLEGY